MTDDKTTSNTNDRREEAKPEQPNRRPPQGKPNPAIKPAQLPPGRKPLFRS